MGRAFSCREHGRPMVTPSAGSQSGHLSWPGRPWHQQRPGLTGQEGEATDKQHALLATPKLLQVRLLAWGGTGVQRCSGQTERSAAQASQLASQG